MQIQYNKLFFANAKVYGWVTRQFGTRTIRNLELKYALFRRSVE
jgi:hypothetical protein